MKKLSVLSIVAVILFAACGKEEISKENQEVLEKTNLLLYDFNVLSEDVSFNEEPQTILLTDTATGGSLNLESLSFKVKSTQKPVIEFVYKHDEKGLSVNKKIPEVDITSTYKQTTDAGIAYNYLSEISVSSIPTQVEDLQVPLDICMILKNGTSLVADTITFEYRPKYDDTEFSPVYLNKKYWAPINIGATAIKGENSQGDDDIRPNLENPWNKGSESCPIKSDSDPCPKGWRVPVKYEFGDIGLHYFNGWRHHFHIYFQEVPYFSLRTGLFSETLILPLKYENDMDYIIGDRTFYYSSTCTNKGFNLYAVVELNADKETVRIFDTEELKSSYCAYIRCIQE
ncbi:MAG: hypothetical protein PARBA_03925 [Parabacteroides sp.]